MNTVGWVCSAVGTILLPATAWWMGFLSGRRYESGVWERWLDKEEEVQEATKQRRGVRLKTMRIRR